LEEITLQTKQSEEKRSTLRRNAILEALDLANSIKVSTLSNDLHVSEVTIRKDLEYLEAEGLLVKIHGGARKCENTSSEIRLHHKQAEKKQIAEAAAALVKEGDFIFLSVGSTCSYVCEALKSIQNLTIVTNSVSIMNSLLLSPSITTFFLGGKVHTEMQITVGDDVLEQLDKYTADKLFLGMDGIDLKMGATTYNHVEDAIMRKMMQRAKEKILVVDDSKFGRVTFAKIANLTDFDTIVTNYNKRNEEMIEQIRALNINVICT
jgi:DeoR/GlpR family transcriptional regulator of sugar metabolism